MNPNLFIILMILAAIFGFWLQWYGERCVECQERKEKILDFFNGKKDDSGKGLSNQTPMTASYLADKILTAQKGD